MGFIRNFINKKEEDIISDSNIAVNSLEKELGRVIKFVAMTVDDYDFGKKKKDPILMNALIKDKIMIIGKDSDLL